MRMKVLLSHQDIFHLHIQVFSILDLLNEETLADARVFERSNLQLWPDPGSPFQQGTLLRVYP
jgi:hypothetical protein